jgi:hypothetical protein
MNGMRAEISVMVDATSEEGFTSRLWAFILLCCRPEGAPPARLRPRGGTRWFIVPAMGVPLCCPFEGNGRGMSLNVRDTVNGCAMCLSVARTPALKEGGM